MKPIIIGICGRSCSGKSRVSRHIEEKYAGQCLHIEQDKFFKVKSNNWESPDAVRFDKFIYSIKKLKKGESTHIPSHRWTEIFDRKVEPKEIVIVEGFLLFTKKELVDLLDLKIFVDVSDFNLFYRRLKRNGNIGEMGYIVENVIKESKKYGELQRKQADVIIDGNMPKVDVFKKIDKLIEKMIN